MHSVGHPFTMVRRYEALHVVFTSCKKQQRKQIFIMCFIKTFYKKNKKTHLHTRGQYRSVFTEATVIH